MSVPNPITWIANVTTFAATRMNTELRDAVNFLLGRGAGCKEYARLTVSSPPAGIANNSTTYVAFDTEDWDTRAGHSTSTNNSRYVAQDGGKYRLTGQVSWTANATGDRAVVFRVNGTTIIAANTFKSATGSTQVNASVDIALNATDFVEMGIFQTSGGALSCIAGNGGTFLVVEWSGV